VVLAKNVQQGGRMNKARIAAISLFLGSQAVAAPFVWSAKWISGKPSEVKTGGVMRWTYLSDHKTLNPFTTAETGNIPRQLAATGGLFILAESELSFIGRGIREPYSSWGLLLNDVTQDGFSSFTDRPWVLMLGFFIVLTILSWNFVGDGLRDALDPKKRR
jgi:ABC-type microcin C transport system permease subunit YejE